ncbi:Fur family transcriptional regulator [Aquisalimonas asiatica]|uniref:Fur family transcriptional regulator, zinc uptake regulator n=1 Tax=Aquisalimonas asiatica TaxID=406100 RepID=A0A1H8S0C5_9GAMM|nr:Fur family transcriptional regulator [Aquisalimonas asiatica]SEO71986.1 Fur family transcriptional regulator, zinc uptake regulator [Aquisalimonas asiatica]
MGTNIVTPFKHADHDHDHCVDDALARAEQQCTENGVRLTAIRRRVLELIWRRHEPMKAYDLLDMLRAERRSAAPPTVYRALDFLLEEGLIHRIESLNAYVGCGDPHRPHVGQFLICQRCNAVAELNDGDVYQVLTSKAEELGFQVNSQTIEINGFCPACRDAHRTTGD